MAVAHEVQLGQVVDDLGVDGGLELEVELFDGLSEREVGEAQPGREPALAGGVDLALSTLAKNSSGSAPLVLASSASSANTSAVRTSLK